MRVLLTMTLSLLLVGCITENNYPTKLGTTFCKKLKECEPEQFDAEYDSVSDCRDTAKEQFGDSDSDYSDCLNDAGCKFDSGEARECRNAISDASCDDNFGQAFVEACAEIYDCSDADQEAIASCFSTQ